MQETPKASRLHIAIFGRRNAGKSSLINALTNQDIALVSSIPGTTTDPVYKAMEILPIGPVMIIDTAGIDDVGELGELRIERTRQVLNKADLAIVVLDAEVGLAEEEKTLISDINKRNMPIVAVVNKSDLISAKTSVLDKWESELGIKILAVSAKEKFGLEELKGSIIKAAPTDWEGPPIIGDLISEGDAVVLVVPVDSAAPKGRLILPQVQTIRDIIDKDAYSIVAKETQLKQALKDLAKPPKLVVTDSQAFAGVSADTPEDVLLTSFSILFARHKGDLETFVMGAKAIAALRPGDKVLIAEACTHHRQEDDIGQVKIPRWLNKAVGGQLEYEWYSGGGFPSGLSSYKMIIHCGACMITRREMLYRLSVARQQDVPIVNYGVLIAYLHGILDRALAPFPKLKQIIQGPETYES